MIHFSVKEVPFFSGVRSLVQVNIAIGVNTGNAVKTFFVVTRHGSFAIDINELKFKIRCPWMLVEKICIFRKDDRKAPGHHIETSICF